MKTRFMVIGYGWRADFFYRIARLAPERFEICAGVLRTPERASQVAEEQGVFATADLEEALKTEPEFAVLCVPRGIVKDYLVRLMERGIPVLTETPPGKNVQELEELWQEKVRLNGKVQVLEQYFLQPYYAAVQEIIRGGYLGQVSYVMLSALHGYHAVSMYRKLLGIGWENCTISGKRFYGDLTATNGRAGFEYSGRQIRAERDWAYLEFMPGSSEKDGTLSEPACGASGIPKVALFDFSGEQYFSTIRRRRWNIQGSRGEIDDDTVDYLTCENQTARQEIRRQDIGLNNNSQWAHKGILFGEKLVYENPFYPARMNDDEIAVASCLERMKKYVETGEAFYPLEEALQDTYLSFLLEEAVQSGKTVVSETKAWAKEER